MKAVYCVLLLGVLCLQVFGDDQYPCYLPAKVGPCKAGMPRFYYNTETKTCKQFTYGGCDGNDNRFLTIGACQAACGSEEYPCNLPAKGGRCKAYMPRFYYNTETKTCDRFIYGGCDGNDNRFLTIDACQAACGSEVDRCFLPVDDGPCYAYIEMYYYNSETRICEQFIYGGCGGNNNRFDTIYDCQDACAIVYDK